MLKVKFVKEVISEDVLDYSLDGKIEPTFYNTGEANVRISGALRVPDGPPFNAGFVGAQAFGNIELVFSGTGKQEVTCYYGIERKENC